MNIWLQRTVEHLVYQHVYIYIYIYIYAAIVCVNRYAEQIGQIRTVKNNAGQIKIISGHARYNESNQLSVSNT